MRALTGLLFAATMLISTTAFGQVREVDAQYRSEINVLVNPGFENGLVRWSSTGTSPALESSAGDVAYGNRAASWDATATSHTFSTQQYTMPNLLESNYCEAWLYYKGGDANIDLKVIDGSSNVLGKLTLSAATAWTKASAIFNCPESGTVGWTLESTADAAEIFVDQAGLGRSGDLANSIGTQEAQNCSLTTTDTSGNISQDFCTYIVNGNQVLGVASFFWSGNGDSANLEIQNFPLGIKAPTAGTGTGDDFVVGNGFTAGCGTDDAVSLIYDKTDDNVYAYRTGVSSGDTFDGNDCSGGRMKMQFSYEVDPANLPANINPIQKLSTSAWWAQAFSSYGSGISLGTSTDGSYQTVDTASGDLGDSSNKNAPIYQACASAVPNADTCSSGDERLGIAVNIPKAGSVMVCASADIEMADGGTADVEQFMRLAQYTATASPTSVTTGRDRDSVRFTLNGTDVDRMKAPVRACEIFEVDSAGLHSFVIEEFTTVNTSVTTNTIHALGWQVFPVDQQLPQALIISGADARVWLNTADGYGSAGTAIRTFDAVTKNVGSALTYTADTTNGDYVTINEGGIYSVVVGDRNSSGSSCDFGASVNASSLTQQVENLALDEWLCYNGNNGAGNNTSCSFTGRFASGDVIRHHGNPSGLCNGVVHTYLKIEKLAN